MGGKQLNRKINPTQSSLYEFTSKPKLKGKAVPKAREKNDDLWVHGLNVGVDLQF